MRSRVDLSAKGSNSKAMMIVANRFVAKSSIEDPTSIPYPSTVTNTRKSNIPQMAQIRVRRKRMPIPQAISYAANARVIQPILGMTREDHRSSRTGKSAVVPKPA
jgi:hypothetical protein